VDLRTVIFSLPWISSGTCNFSGLVPRPLHVGSLTAPATGRSSLVSFDMSDNNVTRYGASGHDMMLQLLDQLQLQLQLQPPMLADNGSGDEAATSIQAASARARGGADQRSRSCLEWFDLSGCHSETDASREIRVQVQVCALSFSFQGDGGLVGRGEDGGGDGDHTEAHRPAVTSASSRWYWKMSDGVGYRLAVPVPATS
jgi:hypothetical protein